MEMSDKIQVNPDIIDCLEKKGKKEAYLLNNRLFAMYINPSELRKQEYQVNWEYIKFK